MKIQEVMTQEVAWCDPGTSAARAAELMWNRNCGVLPVVEGGKRLVGIVTDRDLFIALGTSNRPAAELRVGEVVKGQNLSVCSPGDDVRIALTTMAEKQVRRLPVVERDGSLKGIVTVDDIALRAEADGLSNDEVLRTVKAIWGRQIHRKAGPVQTAKAAHAA